jgi:hypothetical protein
MYVWLVIIIIRLSAREDYLKRQAASWHRRDSNSHRVNKLAVILLVIVRVFLPHPALKVWDIALKVSH